jgi:hypothetical protein
MRLLDYTIKLLGLSETIHRWQGAVAKLDSERRESVAIYAERIAETLGRAAATLAVLEKEPGATRAAREAIREAGVKRRLDRLPAGSRCARLCRVPMRSALSICWRLRATSGPWPTA